MDENAYREALKNTVDNYEWPDTYVPDPERILQRTYSGTSYLQDGYEVMILNLFHECAWNLAWVDASQSGDTSGADRALSVLTEDVPNREGTSPSSSQWAIDSARALSLGDSSMAHAFIEQNCMPVDWIKT